MITVRKLKLTVVGTDEERKQGYKFIRDSQYAQYQGLNLAMGILSSAYLESNRDIKSDTFKEAQKSLTNSNPIFDNISFGTGIDTKSAITQRVKKDFKTSLKNGLAKGERTMQRFITDERTGIRYELIGDYYYPCLTVEKSPPLSKYGRLRQRYLREHKRVLYFNLLTSGKLYEHLAEIDTSARDMAEYLIKEMAKKQGVTEELKATDMMRWIGLMNNIRACADEIVLNDIVYS